MSSHYFRNLALETVFPSFCQLCGEGSEDGRPLCGNCEGKIQFIGWGRCEVCGKAFEGEVAERRCGDCLKREPAFDAARAWAQFEEPMAQIIHRFKYNRGFYYLDWLAAGLTEVCRREFAERKFDLIIPVPLHWLRILRRGYNQAFMLAKPLGKRLKIPVAAGALARTRNTMSQTGLSPAERRENLKKSFVVRRPGRVAAKNILLVDDVMTTGTTVNEAAKTLKKAGAEEVCVVAVART